MDQSRKQKVEITDMTLRKHEKVERVTLCAPFAVSPKPGAYRVTRPIVGLWTSCRAVALRRLMALGLLLAINFQLSTIHCSAVSVDVYNDMESGANGAALTETIVTNSVHGPPGGSWSVTGNMYVTNRNETQLRGSVTAGGTQYFDQNGSRTWAVRNDVNLNCVSYNFPSAKGSVVFSGFINMGPPAGTNQRYDYVNAGIGSVWAVMQLISGNSNTLYLNIEANQGGTAHSGGINVSPGTTYWYSFRVNAAGGSAALYLYEITNWTSLGNVSLAMDPGTIGLIRVGQAANHGNTSPTWTYFDDFCVSWTDTTFPFVPDPATPPTISAIADQVINADTSTAALAFTVGDAQTAAGSLTLGKASSNQTLVPTNNIVFGGSGSNRTVTVTPVAGQSGSATITIIVSDGVLSASNSFVLTASTPPVISGVADQVIGEDVSTGPLSFTVGDGESAAGSLTLGGASSDTNLVPVGNVVFGGSGANRTVTVTPAANQNGAATITISVSDGALNANTNFLVTVNAVNDAPTISGISSLTISVNETAGPLSFTIGDVETVATSLTLSGDSSDTGLVPANNIVFGGSGSNRTVTVTPVAGQNGTATITVIVSDGALGASNSFVLTASTPPVISGVADQVINEDASTGPLSFTVGDAESAAGSLTLGGASSDTNLVPAGNIVFGGSGANRTVTVTPATNQNGAATITISVSDGALNASTNFLVTVNAVNDAPTITGISNQTINANGTSGPLSFTIGDVETATGSLTLGRSSSNTTLVPTNNIVFGGSASNRTVTVTPVTGQNGTATITVIVSDGALSASNSFVLTVNGPPVITGVANQVINEDASTGPLSFTVGDAESAPGSLTLGRASSNTNLVPAGNIVFGGSGANRTVTVTPATNQNGTATITISVSDGALNASTNFLVTVNAVNDAPTITGISNQTININGTNGPLSFNIGDVETVASSLTLSGGSSNTGLVPTNNIVFGGSATNRTVTVTPVAGQSGSATVTVIVSDGALSASNSFVLTVNGPPAITGIAGQVINEDTSTGPLSFTVGDAESAAGSLTLGRASSNTNLVPLGNIVLGGSGANRTVTVTPATNQNGAATITISVSDGALNASTNFLVTVNAVNDAPTITGISNQTINVDGTAGPLSFKIGDVETVATSLTLSGGSSDTGLVPTNNIVFGGSATNRTVTVTPVAGQIGSATITIIVSDGTLSASNSFVLTASTPPVISGVADQVINEDASTGPLSFTVGDAESAPGSLTLGRASSDANLVPAGNIVFGGSGANRTVTVTPATNQNGTATITISVSDGALNASTNFLVTVNAVNDAPTITGISNQTINVNGTNGPLSFTIGDVETVASSLTLSGGSSNTGLVPTNNIVFGGSGSNRTVTVTPVAGQIGSATITISVSDGALSASNSFVLTVSSQPPGTKSFTNGAAITIPNQGAATLYPSTISVSGLGGVISNVTVSLRDLTHTWKADLDVLLVSPGGQKVLVMSDVGSAYTRSGSVTITLSDSASQFLPQASALATGTFKPTDYAVGGADTFNSPAPAGPYGTNLSGFNGNSANGTWSLYVMDDGAGDQGSIATGWSLTVATVISGPQAPTISDIANQATTANTPTAAIPFIIGDADMAVANLTLSGGSSNTNLVAINNIVFGGSGANRTVTVTPETGQSGSATITVTVSDGVLSASDTFVLTVTPANTPPTISGVADQVINEDTSTGPLSFTVGDAETAAGSLTLGKGSSDTNLVPVENIVFGGSGANRTVTVTPATNQNGTATITVSVSDSQLTVSTNFLVTVNAVNDAPTITGISNQTISANGTTGPLSFTIGDVETVATSLTLSGGSSNTVLVPTNNIVFGGSASNRTVTVTPVAGQSGTATITVSVSDGALSASNSFVLTVNVGNTPPTISSISNQTINEDTSTGPLSFTVGDAETAAGSLTLGGGSSDTNLVPVENIVFGGSGANRTVTVTPATNQNGTATITVTVSDGQSSRSTNLLVTVNAVNDAPTITGIPNQTINVNGTTGPLSITIGDVETAAGSLTLSRSSSNTTLVPTNNIVFGGSGSNRTVTVTPAANLIGSATIAVIVSDGQLSASNSFVLTVSVAPSTKSFTNGAAITIPDLRQASPYPSTISVSGMGGVISNVTVSLRGLSHTWKADIDALLVSPGGQTVILMSDAGNAWTPSGSATITLSDSAAAFLPSASALVTGTFKPTDYAVGGADTFNAPAPAGPYGTNLSGFNGQSANGTWSLYVMDDGAGDQGSIATGWSLTITTAAAPGPSLVSIEMPPQITGVEFDGQDAIRVSVSGQAGLSYALEASSDQFQWTQVDVQDNKTGLVVLSEERTTNSIRFYRAVSVPQ